MTNWSRIQKLAAIAIGGTYLIICKILSDYLQYYLQHLQYYLLNILHFGLIDRVQLVLN